MGTTAITAMIVVVISETNNNQKLWQKKDKTNVKNGSGLTSNLTS
ncbi:unnamed protein product [marine sediment metagenome]|uniref:Uncharacterized protein n=1 Tax=marine sediment metagenome TaxID=412755 RepID=X1LW86_9ZZZZ